MNEKSVLTRLGAIGLVLAALVLNACGGTIDLTCDEVRRYQLAEEGRRIQPPEDLSALDELKEMPLPKASPNPQRPPGSPCLDRPPVTYGSGS